MAISFATNTNFKRKSDNIKRIQIHVVEAQGLYMKGSTKSPPAYVTVESPGFGTLHRTGIVGKDNKMVWHENSRIVELKPTAGIKFTVKRQALWPKAHDVLGSTDTYDLGKLIEMQGKNDRETCVTLALNPPPKTDGKPLKSSILVNIRDLDTQEQMQQVREYAAHAASMRKGKQRDVDSSTISDVESFPTSVSSLDLPRIPMTASSSFSTTSAPLPSTSFPPLPSKSASAPHLPLLPPAMTAEVIAATSMMSTAFASPTTQSSTSSLSATQSTASLSSVSAPPPPPPVASTIHRRRSSTCSSKGKAPSLIVISEELQ